MCLFSCTNYVFLAFDLKKQKSRLPATLLKVAPRVPEVDFCMVAPVTIF